MQVASRPRLNAGIAVVGASVIAVCPLAPQMPDVHLPSVQSAAVELASAVSAIAAPVVSPIEQWTQVVQAAITNLGALGQQLAADPDPILKQILANQSADGVILGKAGAAASTALTTAAQALPAALQTAATQLEAGDVTAAVTTLTGPVLPLLLGLYDAAFTGADAWQVVQNTVQNVENVVDVVPAIGLPAIIAVAAPLISVINANTAVAQAVVTAARAGDLEGVATAIINDPATVTGAFLNGYGDLPGLGFPVGGLLSGPGIIPGFTSGTVNELLSLRDQIAEALAPAATKSFVSTAPAALTAAATTVTLATAPATKAIEAPKLVGLPKLHVPVTAPRTVPSGTTVSGATVTDATATATGGAAVPVNSGGTSAKPANANNPVSAAVGKISAGITKAVSGGTGKSSASAGSRSTGKSAGSSKGSGGGGRHRK
jgi:hypothetical protein